VNLELADKAALVLCAGGGLGSSIASTLAREGAYVVLTDQNENALRDPGASIRSAGEKVVAIRRRRHIPH
jgi:NAD(P)-dependent dehydrogenase (short-subunit alcohol dehydrogenase family)